MATTSVALGGSLGPLQVPLAMVFGQPLECPQKWHGKFYRQKVIWVCQKKPLESSGYLFFCQWKMQILLGILPLLRKGCDNFGAHSLCFLVLWMQSYSKLGISSFVQRMTQGRSYTVWDRLLPHPIIRCFQRDLRQAQGCIWLVTENPDDRLGHFEFTKLSTTSACT